MLIYLEISKVLKEQDNLFNQGALVMGKYTDRYRYVKRLFVIHELIYLQLIK
jgi:hypothetical protein